jgi:hypothetical protein
MAPTTFKRIIFADRPKTNIDPDVTFKRVEVPFGESMKPGKHSALVKVNYVSLGAY